MKVSVALWFHLELSVIYGSLLYVCTFCVDAPCASAPSEVGVGHVTEGSCSSSTDSGSSCELDCEEGYESSGSMEVTCSLGEFSALEGSCYGMSVCYVVDVWKV